MVFGYYSALVLTALSAESLDARGQVLVNLYFLKFVRLVAPLF